MPRATHYPLSASRLSCNPGWSVFLSFCRPPLFSFQPTVLNSRVHSHRQIHVMPYPSLEQWKMYAARTRRYLTKTWDRFGEGCQEGFGDTFFNKVDLNNITRTGGTHIFAVSFNCGHRWRKCCKKYHWPFYFSAYWHPQHLAEALIGIQITKGTATDRACFLKTISTPHRVHFKTKIWNFG